MAIFFSFSTSALDVVIGQRQALAAVPPGMSRYPLYRRVDGPVWTGAEISHLPGFEPRIVQPVASRYFAYAFPAPFLSKYHHHTRSLDNYGNYCLGSE